IYVTYAQQDENGEDDVKGAGHGYVDVFTTSGTFVRRLISQGQLNSPWGLLIAPPGFGTWTNALLVGNFGDGTINAYNPNNGFFVGTLANSMGNPITIDGLWGLVVGNGTANGGANNTIYFTAGPDGENHGLFGSLHT